MRRAVAVAALALAALAACGHDRPPFIPFETAAPHTPARVPDGGHDLTDPTTTTTAPVPPRPSTTRASRSGTRPAAPTTQPVRAGACGGWEGLVAEYFPAEQVGRACRIMLCESGGNPNAVGPRQRSGQTPNGLFQIVGGTFDPRANVAHAASMSKGGTNWGPWECR